MAENGNGNGNGNGGIDPLASRKWKLSKWILVMSTLQGNLILALSTWIFKHHSDILPATTWQGILWMVVGFFVVMWGGVGAGYGIINVAQDGITKYIEKTK